MLVAGSFFVLTIKKEGVYAESYKYVTEKYFWGTMV